MDKHPESRRKPRVYGFKSKLIPSPPGTKAPVKPGRFGMETPSISRWWFASAVIAALVGGALIGRFLLP